MPTVTPRANAPMLAPYLDRLASQCSRTDISHLRLRPYSCTRRRVSTRLVLTNGLDVWLALRYAHTYGRMPFKRAHARPLAPSHSLATHAEPSIRPVLNTLPRALAGAFTMAF